MGGLRKYSNHQEYKIGGRERERREERRSEEEEEEIKNMMLI